MRGFNGHPDFIVRHELLARIIACGGNPSRGHELDEIGAAPFVLADANARLFGCVNDTVFPTRVRQGAIQPVVRVAVSGGWTERFQRDHQARTRDLACVYGITDRDGFVSTTDIACAREALLQHLPDKHLSIERPVDVRVCHPVLRRVCTTWQH